MKNKHYYDFKKFFSCYTVTKTGKIFDCNNNEVCQSNNSGYLEIIIDDVNIGFFRCKVHRLVAMKYCKIPSHLKDFEFKDLQVNHKDGNKHNNNADNLEWCTAYENNKHARLMKLNDVSKSNSLRWKNKEFRTKTIKNMQLMRKNNPLIGKKNPNFKFTYIFNNNEYLIKDIAEILNISISKAYRHTHLYFNNENNVFSDNEVLIHNESVSTIEKQCPKNEH